MLDVGNWLSGHRGRRIAVACAVLVATLAVTVTVHAVATRIYLAESASRGQTTLRLAASALAGQIRRFEALPPLIADQPRIHALLTAPDLESERVESNAYLKQVNALLGSSDIYVMRPDGDTVAASNHDGPASFVGENFSYRPYFQDALAGERGRFFALGTTSLKRGYYYSSPVRSEASDAVIGVVVVKVDIDAIESTWRGGESEIIVSDPEGIVFMSGRSDWLYRGLYPLTPERLERTSASRRYAETPLAELPATWSRADSLSLLTVSNTGQDREYVALSEIMPEAGWTVGVLVDTASARAQALSAAVLAMLACGLAALAGTVMLLRRARLAERIAMETSAKEELERRVEERTRDLESVNRRLEEEVVERTTAEQQLRRTQDDLVQAGKLAALGQMSAALSHELNQPLAAVKTYADSAGLLIDRNRVTEARDNVARISSLADRMSAISRHLRNFARKPDERLGAVGVVAVVQDAAEIVASRLRATGATLEIDIAPHILVRAGPVRLQQVLVNILSNAADAVATAQDRTIRVSAASTGGRIVIDVRDHGPGVAPAIADRIFDPFFSTKGVGAGLGLGLSISYNIVRDFGGSLTVVNHPDGGAVFSVVLDAASPLAEAAE